MNENSLEIATFAAGCFWGVEDAFMKVRGVKSTRVGYTGGNLANPTYEDVCTDRTGHAEAIQLKYDPKEISYKQILELFWSLHNPTTINRQGPDIGTQYRSSIFFHTLEQEKIAKRVKQELNGSKFQNKIVTEIVPASIFYPAEEYHQKYYQKIGGGSCYK
ncbi:MAG TPA: peptide-methionine (S)-S-oxide reductase MsrA, partial [Nitrososphaeraceae archaeon]|nr:peptide-methionine (S)-S-oxide reductase MsrA [Nitrososphaeraceae archaeon]